MNVSLIREEFPILKEKINGHPLVYLDNAATTQKPEVVIEAIASYYRTFNSNVHRGVHTLSQRATQSFEDTRAKLAAHLGVKPGNVVFTKGSTEAINLVAYSWGQFNVQKGDKILVSELEHHANILPWQRLCKEKGATLVPIPLNEDLDIDIEAYKGLLDERVKLVAISQVSNSVGTVNPVREMADLAHAVGALVMVDGSQGVGHGPVSVPELGADFFAVACHKMYAPTGLGVLVAREELLAKMPPYQVGGGIVRKVTIEESTFIDPPGRFEAGTPNIADVVGLHAAIEWLEKIGNSFDIHAHELALTKQARAELAEIPGVTVHGYPKVYAGIISFTIDGIHPHDIGTILDSEGIAIRAGHHCCQPLMRRLGVPATARASFAAYNTEEEVKQLVKGVLKAKEIFG